MNILFLVPYTPTLIRTRPYNLVRGLARRGNHVTLATLWENEQERAALAQLEAEGICVLSARLTKPRAFWNMLRLLPSHTPLQAAYCWQPELAQLLNSQFAIRNSQFDVIHVEHLRGARYGLQLQSAIRNSQFAIPVVWDSVDCISYLFEQAARHSRSPFGRIVTRLELPRTRRYEAWLVSQFDRVLVTSRVDKAALENLVSSFKFQVSSASQPVTCNLKPETISVLPNGVDLDYFAPSNEPRDPETIVFTGKMSYHANVTAALHLINDIMPHVWRERPDVRVNIVGQNPPRALSTVHCPLITIFGAVPDLRPYLHHATLAVAPMPYGAGIQNKVLEAMACATPVVASPQAVSALDIADGEQLLVGQDPEAFARQILRLVSDRELQTRLGLAGRRYVERQHDWNKIVERLEAIYQEAIQSAA
ncbi:MAG: glycosyltransferase [Chloroflexi bacterium]|nr:glycosyltransferase [Chloroflexota bacterium]